ncbi:MAG: hypothetical protein WB562_05995 [Candidatus Sulfotelmatobacter sp.]
MKGLSKERPAIIAAPDRGNTPKNRVFLGPAQPSLANQHCIDEPLFRVDDMWQGTLRLKQVWQKSIRCNQLRI